MKWNNVYIEILAKPRFHAKGYGAKTCRWCKGNHYRAIPYIDDIFTLGSKYPLLIERTCPALLSIKVPNLLNKYGKCTPYKGVNTLRMLRKERDIIK